VSLLTPRPFSVKASGCMLFLSSVRLLPLLFAMSFLAGLRLADQPVPDFVRHPIFRGVCISRRCCDFSNGREFLIRLVCEIDVRRTLLQPRSLGHQWHLFQLLVVEPANSVAAFERLRR
jgi:hypothetical protein